MSKVLLSISIAVSFLYILSCDENPLGTDNIGTWKISKNTLTDPDGNVYTTVKIGNQVWTVENLKTTKYNNGSAIPNVTDGELWEELTTGAYCYYENNIENKTKYGVFYNWYAVNTGKLAPDGWRVPTDADWDTLKYYLVANGYNWDGTTSENEIAKSLAAKTDWLSSTTAGAIGNGLRKNNASGFSALPGGCRYSNGGFCYYSKYGFWWSATESNTSYAYYRDLGYSSEGLYWGSDDERYGYSVRLVRY